MIRKRPTLGIVALSLSLLVLGTGIVAAFLSAADTGESFGPQFLEAERVWLIAAGAALATLGIGIAAFVSKRGSRFALMSIGVVVLAGPISVVVMDSLPAA